jgi:hypothetical protein
MWTYHQDTGEMLKPDGTRLAFGFAGHSEGMNCPAKQDQHNVGPLPVGDYNMTQWIESDDHLGLCVIVLEPHPTNEMFGRAGFRVHGYRSIERSGLSGFLMSSDGCICISDCVARRSMWSSADHQLRVVQASDKT